MKSILFPFLYETDFRAGYAWSLELATRLGCQLSIFSTIQEDTHQHYSKLYDSLIKARQFHVRTLGILSLGKQPQSVTRHFPKGDFDSNLLQYIDDTKFDVIVLPSTLISESILSKLIRSRKQIIVLPGVDADAGILQPTATRESFFLEMLHKAACYNLSSSFYKSFSNDKSLFNSIASFFGQGGLKIQPTLTQLPG